MHRLITCLLLVICLLSGLATLAAASDADWSPRFGVPGVYNGSYVGTVYAIAYNGSSVYIAGEFDRVGLVPANNIARCTHGQWYALGDGTPGAISDMIVLDQAVYAACRHYNSEDELIYGVARWSNSQWSSIGDEAFNAGVWCLEYDYGKIYAGGGFWQIGDLHTGPIVVWDGEAWLPPAASGPTYPGMLGAVVADIELTQGQLWAVGSFDAVHNEPSPNIAVLDDEEWHACGTGACFDDETTLIDSFGGQIYVGGEFSTVEGQSSPLLARARTDYSLDTFSGSMPDDWVTAIRAMDGWVIVATESSLRTYSYETGWNDPYGSMRIVNCIERAQEHMWVGGALLGPSGYADAVAHWNGHRWYRLGSGLARNEDAPDYVNTFTSYDGFLIAGGYFDVYSLQEDVPHCHNVGLYDGEGWRPLGEGFVDEVNALTVHDGQLIAAGNFDHSGATAVTRLAAWDGEGWQTFAGGAGGEVQCLLDYDGGLVVGGDFHTLGGVACERIGLWRSGTGWESLGAGASSTVRALATDGTDLYVAGQFTTIGGVAANHVARWDGAQWHALGDGLDGLVVSLCFHDGELYAGRRMYELGVGQDALQRWDGEAWHTAGTLVASETCAEVGDILSVGEGLIVAGAFDSIDGLPVHNAAMLTPGGWVDFGSGLSGGHWYTVVNDLHIHDGQLYFGGDFSHAGQYVSASIARWNVVLTPVYLQGFDVRPGQDRQGPRVDLDWRARTGGGAAEFRVTARRGATSWPVSVRQVAADRWTACDRDTRLLDGGDVTYSLVGREAGEDWSELGRQTVAVDVSPTWLRPRLSVAPNPANPRTSVDLWLPRAGLAEVTVHDLRGRRVARLFAGPAPAGHLALTWDGVDDAGHALASGVYLVRATGESGEVSARVTLVR